MKVFLSWSGEPSRSLAETFRLWLPASIQAVQPYFSPDDIAKGTRWSSEIANELEASHVGILFLTQNNLSAPWLLFEAGALAKKLDRSRVCPILFGIHSSDVEGPLTQFQLTQYNKSDIKRLMRTINDALEEHALAQDTLDAVFEMWWPELDKKVSSVLAKKTPPKASSVRSERELLDEVLSLCRSIATVASAEKGDPQIIQVQFEQFLTNLNMLLDELHRHLVPDTLYPLLLQLEFSLRSLADATLPAAEFRFYVDSLIGEITFKCGPQLFPPPSV